MQQSRCAFVQLQCGQCHRQSECVKVSINVNDKYTISVHDVSNAVLHLNKGKTDKHEGLCSDNIINAPHSLFVILTLIYNTMLVHGLSPDSMILGIPVYGRFQ